LDLVEFAVFAIRVPKGTLPLVSAAEYRHIDRLAILAQLFDTPIAGMLAVAEHLGTEIVWAWAAHRRISPLQSVVRHSRHSVNDAICQIMNLDLSDDESTALARLLRKAIDEDRYPLSPRIRLLQAILDKIDPPPARETPPLLKAYEPPRFVRGRRRRG
jgi:hypothetical protein